MKTVFMTLVFISIGSCNPKTPVKENEAGVEDEVTCPASISAQECSVIIQSKILTPGK